jgi:uncharacterized protein
MQGKSYTAADSASQRRSGCRRMLAMIAKELLDILVCPACKKPLEYRQNPESLKCVQCRRVYAVKDDIPIMLIDKATIET